MRALTILRRMAVLLPVAALSVLAHPMGNLSVNHYAKLVPSERGLDIIFAMDLAEIPTFELLQAWNLTKDAPREDLERRAGEEARRWVRELRMREDGKDLAAKMGRTELVIVDGAGNLPVFRITTKLHVDAKGGKVEFEDQNYPARAGWREIVVDAGRGATVTWSSPEKARIDQSQGLTAYPQDPMLAPPQDKAVSFEWSRVVQPVTVSQAPAVTSRAEAPPSTPAVGVRPREASGAGTIQRNDAISKLLRTDHMSWGVIAMLLGLSFWFGALHALEPGHGKTMVAAYLVGARGTPKHAVLLGGMVTFTHTISVFVLGLATMFLSQYIMPEKISKVLGIASGASIIWIGGMMLWRRARKLHSPEPDRDHGHLHGPGTHTHVHGDDGHSHSHLPEGEISLASLMALGASGGLVPCPSALILLLSAISIGKVGLGMLLLVTFSLGLAIVLTATGMLVLFARNLFPARRGRPSQLVRLMPVVSAAAIVLIGIVMTGYSLGILPANRLIG